MDSTEDSTSPRCMACADVAGMADAAWPVFMWQAWNVKSTVPTMFSPDKCSHGGHFCSLCADPTARGNVLESEAVVEIKFRKKELLALMGRCDPELCAMATAPLDQPGREAATLARQEQLLPVYHSIAVHFATMHDTPVIL